MAVSARVARRRGRARGRGSAGAAMTIVGGRPDVGIPPRRRQPASLAGTILVALLVLAVVWNGVQFSGEPKPMSRTLCIPPPATIAGQSPLRHASVSHLRRRRRPPRRSSSAICRLPVRQSRGRAGVDSELTDQVVTNLGTPTRARRRLRSPRDTWVRAGQYGDGHPDGLRRRARGGRLSRSRERTAHRGRAAPACASAASQTPPGR